MNNTLSGTYQYGSSDLTNTGKMFALLNIFDGNKIHKLQYHKSIDILSILKRGTNVYAEHNNGIISKLIIR